MSKENDIKIQSISSDTNKDNNASIDMYAVPIKSSPIQVNTEQNSKPPSNPKPRPTRKI